MNKELKVEGISFEAATPEVLPLIFMLLVGFELPAEDLDPTSLSGFELAFDGAERIVGVAGLNVFGHDALLRSVAVLPDWQGKGIGERLVARREAAASAAGVASVYLLTTAADSFFRHLGYADLPREDVPAAIAVHPQFRDLCPASAKCLVKRL